MAVDEEKKKMQKVFRTFDTLDTACNRERDRLKSTRVAPNLTTRRRRMPTEFV